ncbi:MAG TPA: methionyl-tRNA formyltransferase [Terriglobia bacterium]|nr:methionyl-tRNA formyltransferase [Terriglobia bacterium]
MVPRRAPRGPLLTAMQIVFAGSPQFAVPTLEALAASRHNLRAVVTQPDRPAGREQRLQPPPVKQAALRLGLPIHQPEKIKSEAGRALMESLQPEAVVVVGYGQILPPWLLELPRFGCINLHASLLPAYRGAAPIQWAIANGEKRTGLTTMLMDPGLDTGPILLTWETEIGAEETAVELAERMSRPGADLMLQTLAGLEAGTITPRPQDHSRATKAPLLKKEHGIIDWNWTAQQIYNRLRGFAPWPGVYSGYRGKQLHIWAARPHPGCEAAGVAHPPDQPIAPGELLVRKDRAFAACGAGTLLELLEVQREGRRRMSAAEFFRGAPPRPGEQLGL